MIFGSIGLNTSCMPPAPPPEGALVGVGVKKVPNNLNNNSQFVIYHDKMTLKPSKLKKL